MNTMLCQLALTGMLLAADHLPAQDAPATAPRVAIGNAAVENWLKALEGRWQWQLSDGSQRGDVVLRPVARGRAFAGQGKGFGAGDEWSWLILWDAAEQQLVITMISSAGEYHHATLTVSGEQLSGKFTGTSDTNDGHRSVRGECVWQRDSSSAFSIVWKSLFIANQGQIDRRFEFRRQK